MRTLFARAMACALVAPVAYAADHIDSPAPSATPAADITDHYVWMTSDGTKVNLVMNVSPFATGESTFSDAIVYAFHVSSMATYGAAAATKADVLCHFHKTDGTGIECWLGDEYVAGDPSGTDGIASASGKLKVFAGLRNDPFFFALDGFKAAVNAVVAAAPALSFDEQMCPTVDFNTASAIVGLLRSDGKGGPPYDTFADLDVLSIVVQVDKTLLNDGGPILASWTGTYQMAQ